MSEDMEWAGQLVLSQEGIFGGDRFPAERSGGAGLADQPKREAVIVGHIRLALDQRNNVDPSGIEIPGHGCGWTKQRKQWREPHAVLPCRRPVRPPCDHLPLMTFQNSVG